MSCFRSAIRNTVPPQSETDSLIIRYFHFRGIFTGSNFTSCFPLSTIRLSSHRSCLLSQSDRPRKVRSKSKEVAARFDRRWVFYAGNHITVLLTASEPDKLKVLHHSIEKRASMLVWKRHRASCSGVACRDGHSSPQQRQHSPVALRCFQDILAPGCPLR